MSERTCAIPCRYYKPRSTQGCDKGDRCSFLHEFYHAHIACRNWQKGSCSFGEKCPYSHLARFDPPERQESSTSSQTPSSPATSEAQPERRKSAAQYGFVQNREHTYTDVCLWGVDHKYTGTKMPNGNRVTILDTTHDEYRVVWNGEEGWVKKHHIQGASDFTGSERTVHDIAPDDKMTWMWNDPRSKVFGGTAVLGDKAAELNPLRWSHHKSLVPIPEILSDLENYHKESGRPVKAIVKRVGCPEHKMIWPSHAEAVAELREAVTQPCRASWEKHPDYDLPSQEFEYSMPCSSDSDLAKVMESVIGDDCSGFCVYDGTAYIKSFEHELTRDSLTLQPGSNTVFYILKARKASGIQVEERLGSKWYWGHADSEVEPPCPPTIFKVPLPTEYYRDLITFARNPSYLDGLAAKGKHKHGGCPFLGGSAFVRHEDVKSRLQTVVDQHNAGNISRKNELGYFMLENDAFPLQGTLSLGCPVMDHRVQREWLEHILHPSRLPTRDEWKKEVQAFLDTRTEIKVKGDIAKWWLQMLWKHLLEPKRDRLTWKEASDFLKFQEQWLLCSINKFPSQVATIAHRFIGGEKAKVWPTSTLLKKQEEYRNMVMEGLPQQVPPDHRERVAQCVLEAMVFAGGLSVPSTIHAAIAVLILPSLFPNAAEFTPENSERFVYEVTRLFPAVQGFCYYNGDERQILSLNASLRDPTVWGELANQFSLKDLELYKNNHVGFAQFASKPGTFDSKSCPGYQLTMDVTQEFLLTLFSFQKRHETNRAYWSPDRAPKPAGVPQWFNSFTLELETWLDGDQTGEAILARECHNPLPLARMFRSIEGNPGHFMRILDAATRLAGMQKFDFKHQSKLHHMDWGTRFFFELAKADFHELAKHAKAADVDRKGKKKFEDYYQVELSTEPPVKCPKQSVLKRNIQDILLEASHGAYRAFLDDFVRPEIVVRTDEDRKRGIALCQILFSKEVKDGHGSAKAQQNSYLPKAPVAYVDITSNKAQAFIARCGMGQLFLKTNTWENASHFGEYMCDVSLLHDFKTRECFEKLGAVAFFKTLGEDGLKLELTAIYWCHVGLFIQPKDIRWEHVKWAWRCSMFTHMTIIHHLVHTHWISSNAFSTSIRETLGPHHPVRRLMTVFSYHTPQINEKSMGFLHPDMAVLHRMSPFKYPEVEKAFKIAGDGYKFQTWRDIYEATNLPEDFKKKLPMFEDGLPVWDAMLAFCVGYVDVFYSSDAEVQSDEELQEYWKFSCAPPYRNGLPNLDKTGLATQLAKGMFDVTAYHEFVGGVVEYTTDPAGAMCQVRPGLNMADLQELTLVNSLVCGTGQPVPMFIATEEAGDPDWLDTLKFDPEDDCPRGEWKDIAKFEAVKVLHTTMMKRLKEISSEIQSRNKTREFACRRFDPITFERSVSV